MNVCHVLRGEGGLLRTEANTLGTLQMLKHEHLSCPSGGEGGLLKTEADTLGTLQMLKHERLSCPSGGGGGG